jgi:hypothetical protein
MQDIRELRKELDETIRLVLEGQAQVGQMRAAAEAERLETARLVAQADAMLARRSAMQRCSTSFRSSPSLSFLLGLDCERTIGRRQRKRAFAIW